MEISRFENYAKIQDQLLILGKNVGLFFNLNLYYTSEKYGRRFFHSEVKYRDKHGNDSIKISRRLDPFLSIENLTSNNGIKEFIMISQDSIRALRSLLHDAENFMLKHADKWRKKDGTFVIPQNPLVMQANMGKVIALVPDMIDYGTEQYKAFRLCLNSEYNYTLLSEHRLSAWIETIDNLDMIGYSQNILNYIGRPDQDMPMVDTFDMAQSEPSTYGKPGRRIPGPKRKEELI